MKYCKKCGMLLEDTADTCIRCGNDVTLEANVSMYPPEVMETMDAQKQARKKKAVMVTLIIVIFVALVAVVAVAAIFINKNGFTLAGDNNKKTSISKNDAVEDEDTEEESEEESEDIESDEEESDISDDDVVDEEETDEYDDSEEDTDVEDDSEDIEDEMSEDEDAEEETERIIKDDNGRYYRVLPQVDDNNNVVFNAVIPEDFTDPVFAIDYEKYSTRYPIGMQCQTGLEDGTLSFIYISPQQMWYKNSETGRTRSNERDPAYYMTFLSYDGPKSYVEAILKESYPKAKFELTDEQEISESALANIEKLSDMKNAELFGDIDDYAHVGEDATYANMDANFSVGVYQYEITMPDKQVVFDKFYVPMISNDLYYASEKYNDRGTVTEWYILAFVCMEAGNEDLFDDYSEDFDVFMANAVPTEKFMYISQLYAEDIVECIDSDKKIVPLTKEMLKGYSRKADDKIKLDDFNKCVYRVLTGSGSNKCYGNNIDVFAPEKYCVAFYSEDNGKLFISSESDEYPGEDYTEIEVSQSDGDDSMSNDDADDDDSESEDDEDDESEDGDEDTNAKSKSKSKRNTKSLRVKNVE